MPNDSNSLEPEWFGVLLHPMDVLLFRDGRSFGAANRVVSGAIFPQTVAGAIRTALLGATEFRFERLKDYQGDIVTRLREAGADNDILEARFRGPWYAKVLDDSSDNRGSNDFNVLFPCPANLKRSKLDPSHWLVAAPVPPDSVPGWNHADALWPMKLNGASVSKDSPPWLTLDGLREFLQVTNNPTMDHHGITFSNSDHCQWKPELEYRVGIGIDPQRLSTIDGELYGVGFLALPPEMRIYIEVKTTRRIANLLDQLPISIGGEGKLVQASITPSLDFPKFDATRAKSVWYLSTPTFLRGESIKNRPIPPASFGKVIGAASDAGQAVSGWDVSRGGPRKTRFAVPAGAVYYVEGSGTDGGIMADLPDRDALLQEGWGFAIQGQWSS